MLDRACVVHEVREQDVGVLVAESEGPAAVVQAGKVGLGIRARHDALYGGPVASGGEARRALDILAHDPLAVHMGPQRFVVVVVARGAPAPLPGPPRGPCAIQVG